MTRSALLRRTPVRAVSSKHRAREARLRASKQAWVQDRLEASGYVCCERCGRSFSELRDAMAGLEGHHRRKRSLGGGDEPGNMEYLCWKCHGKEHE